MTKLPASIVALHKGARVKTTGRGRTATWKPRTGTVTRRRGLRVFVQWDGLGFEDEVDAAEVFPSIAAEFAARPPARARRSRRLVTVTG